jgi:hypothetical protein
LSAGRTFSGKRFGLGQAFRGELVRHAVLAHGDLDLHAGVVDLAQHFSHAANGLAEQGRRLGELHHDHLPHLGGTGRALGNQDVLPIALVFRGYEPDAAFVQQAADDRLLGTLDDLDHASFGTTAAVLAHDARLDAVLVQHRAHLVRGQVDVRLAVIALHEAVTVAMSLNSAFEFVQQAAGIDIIFDMISFFPEIQNVLAFAGMWAQMAELVDALVSGTSE